MLLYYSQCRYRTYTICNDLFILLLSTCGLSTRVYAGVQVDYKRTHYYHYEDDIMQASISFGCYHYC